MESPDRALLERYVTYRDDAAFRVLVERHLDLVHSVARRVTGSDDMARDLAQSTFIRLAQRAALIPKDITLTAWLHRTTRSLAIDLVRTETNRKQRERSTAALQHLAMEPSPDPAWSALEPVIDELIDTLPAADRDVLLLRYYRNESHASIAGRLGLTEEVARKRASRALEKLRAMLGKRNLHPSASALATLLPSHAISSAPTELLRSVASASQGITPIAPAGLHLHLAMTATQKSAIAAAAVIFLSSLGYALRPTTDAVATQRASAGVPDRSLTEGPAQHPRTASLRLPATPEDRLVRLKEILEMPISNRRTREFLDFVDLLSLKQFEEIAERFRDIGDRVYSQEFWLLLQAWRTLDRPAAVGWAFRRSSTPSNLIQDWAMTDPTSAVAWLEENSPESFGHDPELRQSFVSILSAIAQQDPETAVKALQMIPDAADRSDALLSLHGDFSYANVAVSAKLCELTTGDPIHPKLVASAVQGLISNQRGDEAIALLLSDSKAREVLSISDAFASMDDTALAYLEKMPDSPDKREAVNGVSKRLAWTGRVAEGFDLLTRYGQTPNDLLIAKMTESSSFEDYPRALAEITKMQDPVLRDEVMRVRIDSLMKRNPELIDDMMKRDQMPAAAREIVEKNPRPADKP